MTLYRSTIKLASYDGITERCADTECPDCLMDTLWKVWSDQFYCCMCDQTWTTYKPMTDEERTRHYAALSNAVGHVNYITGSQATDSQIGLIAMQYQQAHRQALLGNNLFGL